MSSDIKEIVRQVINEYYGIEGTLSRLPGENINYLVDTADGKKYVAKTAGIEMPPAVIEMEYAALEHLSQANLGLSLSTIIKNKYGKIESGINIHNKQDKRLRLLDYIGGEDLSDIVDISDEIRCSLGETLGRFDLAMADFSHPAFNRSHRWNLAEAGQHSTTVNLVKDAEKQALLRWAFEQWTNQASPVFGELDWQFIHGDANPENIRIRNRKVVGLIDFGDSGNNPLVCDLAICLAYQMMDQADPWAAAEQVISGFEGVRPLSSLEHSVLLPLICGRLAVTISVATKRWQIDIENSNWFVSEKSAWTLLAQIRASGGKRFFS